MKTNTRRFGPCFSVLTLILAIASSLAEGIPEPPVVLYGTIRNTAIWNARVTSGSLVWRITRLTNGVPAGSPFTVSTAVGNVLGQFSYVVQIPCETSAFGAISTNTNVLQLISSINYYRLEAFLDGLPTSFVNSSQDTLIADQQTRGLIMRTDLNVNAPCEDINANGICDWWEAMYFNDFVIAEDDADNDGMSNLDEFLAGTNPTNALSALFFISYEIHPAGGFKVEWVSSEGRSYSLLRSSNLLSTNADPVSSFSVIRTNIPATPPLNTLIDSNAIPPGPYFYLLRLEL